MAGLDPAVHVFLPLNKQDVDTRHRAGYDEKALPMLLFDNEGLPHGQPEPH